MIIDIVIDAIYNDSRPIQCLARNNQRFSKEETEESKIKYDYLHHKLSIKSKSLETLIFFHSYINFLAEMVANEKNPSEAKKKAVEEQKKVIVYSPKGKPF